MLVEEYVGSWNHIGVVAVIVNRHREIARAKQLWVYSVVGKSRSISIHHSALVCESIHHSALVCERLLSLGTHGNKSVLLPRDGDCLEQL